MQPCRSAELISMQLIWSSRNRILNCICHFAFIFLTLNIPDFALSSIRAPATLNPCIFQEQMMSSPRVEISKTFTFFMLQEIFDKQRVCAIMHQEKKNFKNTTAIACSGRAFPAHGLQTIVPALSHPTRFGPLSENCEVISG